MHKRLRQDLPKAPGNITVPTTPGQGAVVSGVLPPPQREGFNTTTTATGLPRDSRHTNLTPQEKVRLILQRHGTSFSDELGIPLQSSTPASLWQWFCASILFSARIKSNAGLEACQALFAKGWTTAQSLQNVTKEQCQAVLKANGYDRYDDKAAGFLVENAAAVMSTYSGDLNQLREAANRNPSQERSMLKKYKGVGDGGVDIFFREVQLVWQELYPFADKKALKAARLVGLREHPQALADLCGNDVHTYVRLIAALVRIELSKTFHEY